jgi:hypothetical protein
MSYSQYRRILICISVKIVFIAILVLIKFKYKPPIQWVPGGGLFPRGVKRPEHEADHSPPTSAEGKKMWVYTSTPPYGFMA